MERKIAALLLAALLALSVIGCGGAKEGQKEEAPADETLFSINGTQFHLDTEKSFNGLGYSISSGFREVIHDEGFSAPYVQYDCLQRDGTNLLFFRIFYYKGGDAAAAAADLGLDAGLAFTDGKTENIDYQLYTEPRDDGGTMHFYFVRKDSDTWAVCFISRYDIEEFEHKVMESVRF